MNDVFVVEGVRTAVGAFGKTLRDIPAADLGSVVLQRLMEKSGLAKETIDEIIFGHGYVHGGGLNSARIASHKAGFPYTVPSHVVIKACGSSLKAITIGAMSIMSGQSETVIAGGVESMSQVPYLVRNRWGSKYGNVIMEDALMSDGLTCSIIHEPMGITAERLAVQYGVSRAEQDQFAYDSHLKANKAMETGIFREEIVPVHVTAKHSETMFDRDESVRTDISLEKLNVLPPVFQQGGTVTAGNACPMNDGAAGIILMTGELCRRFGLRPLAKIKAFASAGVDPKVMGIGPVPATLKALEIAGLSLEDIGLIELNEAFASQSLAVIKQLSLDPGIVNVNGGAIALGHPVGATGAKLTVTILHEMRRRNVRYGLVTLCMAGGMGLSVIYENTDF